MKKRILALLLAGVMALGLTACGKDGGTTSTPPAETGSTTPANTPAAEPETKTVKVGLICIGDENDQGYTYNFIRGKDAATEALAAKGIEVEWIPKWNIEEGSGCEDANIELAEEGCDLIINNSYGFEPFMLKVAPNYPDIEFIACTNQASWNDGTSIFNDIF